jgi:DNA-binding response OmpR family regulator
MAKILLANFEEEAGVRLSVFLRNEHHEVCLAFENDSFSQMLRRCGPATDLLILDVSRREKYTRDLLAQITSHRVQYGPRPMLLCISRAYRGAQFELDLERKGARVVYVH